MHQQKDIFGILVACPRARASFVAAPNSFTTWKTRWFTWERYWGSHAMEAGIVFFVPVVHTSTDSGGAKRKAKTKDKETRNNRHTLLENRTHPHKLRTKKQLAGNSPVKIKVTFLFLTIHLI